MKIVIHARHAELAADFREIAEEKLRTMDRFFMDFYLVY